MQETILLRGASNENREAKRILKAHNVAFVEVYSDYKSHPPVLYTDSSVYAYKGLSQIKEFVAAHSIPSINVSSVEV